jgi:serine phosphatase RsbU (regulator of sigma subunit)/tetratricopeptide (TPR) repeat protein
LKKFLPLLLLFFSVRLFSQVYDGNDLISRLSKPLPDTAKANLLQKLSKYYIDYGSVDQADSCVSLALKLSEKNGSKELSGWIKLRQGQTIDARGDYDKAISVFGMDDEYIDTTKFPLLHSMILQSTAGSFYFKGAYSDAMNFYMRALKIRETLDDSVGIAASLMGVANVYNDMLQKEKSIVYYEQALGIMHRYKNERMESWILNNIGASYVSLNENKKALEYFRKSMVLKEKLGDEYGLSTTYNNFGSIYLESKSFDSALYYFTKAYSIRRHLDDTHEIAMSYYNIALACDSLGEIEKSLAWCDSSITTAENSSLWGVLKMNYILKAKLLAGKGDFKSAYEFMSKAKEASDTVFTTETTQQISQLMAQYDSEKKEQQIALQKSEIKSAGTFRNFLIALVGGALILVVMLFLGYKRKQKTSELLAAKNSEIELQRKIVEEKNRDITDSITYALRIQKALLPGAETKQRLLPDSFILYRPKDIVAGDFYMIEEFGLETIVAAIDCTGHGVPGAFMTFVAYDLFNEAVGEHGITEPSAILNRMRKRISGMLKQKGESYTDVKDGMDVCVCKLNADKTMLTYAGAFRPLWIIRNGSCMEIIADKFPVSADDTHNQVPFTQHEIPLQKGDTVYLFTDGFADQFGGPKGKKFKVAKLKELLLEISSQSMNEQHQRLENEFVNWKGNLEQLDDVLVMGIRL